MTLVEFFDAWKKEGRLLGILCRTDEEVSVLSDAFSELGECWASRHSYRSLAYSAPVVYFNSNTKLSAPFGMTTVDFIPFEEMVIDCCPICKNFDVKTFKKERYCLSCGAYTLDGQHWVKEKK